MKYFSIIVAGSLILAGCNNTFENKEDAALLKEAANLHNEAIATHNEVMQLLNGADSVGLLLEARRIEIEKSAKPDTARVSALRRTVSAILKADEAMDQWMDNLVEVPGNEHDHHHGEGGEEHGEAHEHEHHHEHENAPALTPKQMRDVQQEAKNNIIALQKSLTSSLAEANTLLK
jgi:hypothetical protein